MTDVGSAYLNVVPQAKGFAASLNAQVGPAFQQAGANGGHLMATGVEKDAKGKFAGAGKALAGGLIAGFVAAGAQQITQAVTQWIGDAIGLASGLEQSVGSVDAVFKENSETIHEWARGAAEDLGLSENSYNELATIIGSQLKNMGMDMDDVTGQTGDLIGLGADLAAQFGGSTADAVSALSSLLRGERDPIERYGVSINEAAVQAKLAEMGLSGLTGEAEKNAKLQATLALLTEQTADAQGAFARESDTLAGQQARVNAELENMQTEIGMALLPVVSELLRLFQSTGMPVLRELVRWFTENQDAIMAFASAVIDGGLWIVNALLGIGTSAAVMAVQFIGQVRETWNFFSAFVQGILDGAVKAFGWVPGIGDKLKGASSAFRNFSDDVDRELGQVQDDAYAMAQTFVGAQGAVNNLSAAINRIPTKKSVVVTVTERGVLRQTGDTYSYGGGAMGFRASGGPVVAGRPYIVGEHEPELFVPNQSGMIYNQAQLAAMGGQGSAGVNLPETVTLVDAGGALLGRMRVVADSAIASEANQFQYAGGRS